LAPKATGLDEMTQNSCHHAMQGHSASPHSVVPIDSKPRMRE